MKSLTVVSGLLNNIFSKEEFRQVMRRSLLRHQQVSGSIPSFVAEEQQEEEGC